jgi:hypothetical protein
MSRLNVKSVTFSINPNHNRTRMLEAPSIKCWVFEGTRNVNHTHLGKLRNLAQNYPNVFTLIENN